MPTFDTMPTESDHDAVVEKLYGTPTLSVEDAFARINAEVEISPPEPKRDKNNIRILD